MLHNGKCFVNECKCDTIRSDSKNCNYCRTTNCKWCNDLLIQHNCDSSDSVAQITMTTNKPINRIQSFDNTIKGGGVNCYELSNEFITKFWQLVNYKHSNGRIRVSNGPGDTIKSNHHYSMSTYSLSLYAASSILLMLCLTKSTYAMDTAHPM